MTSCEEILSKYISDEKLAELKEDTLTTLVLISKLKDVIPLPKSPLKNRGFVKYLNWNRGLSASFAYGVGMMSCSCYIYCTRENKYFARLYFGSIDDSSLEFYSPEFDTLTEVEPYYDKLLAVFNRLTEVPSEEELQEIMYETGCCLGSW